jgi:hypothetical protein
MSAVTERSRSDSPISIINSTKDESIYQTVSVELRLAALDADIQGTYRKINQLSSKTSSLAPTKLVLEHLVTDFQCLITILYREKLIDALQTSSLSAEKKFQAQHAMINNLTAEWTNLSHLIAAILFKQLDDPVSDLSWLNALVVSAARDLGLNENEIFVLPDYNKNFSLTRLSYSSDIVILEFPITALETPWEWSIIWHEMAGYKVQKMKESKKTIFRQVLEKSQIPIIELDEKKILNNLLSGEAIVNLFPKSVQPSIRAFSKRTSSPANGWFEGYVEELFEDSCSTLAFEKPFVEIFKLALNRRNYQDDYRHPSPSIRTDIANKLLDDNFQSAQIPDLLIKNLKELFQEIPVAQKASANYDGVANTVREIIKLAMIDYLRDPDGNRQIAQRVKDDLIRLKIEMPFDLGDASDAPNLIRNKINGLITNQTSDEDTFINALVNFPLAYTDWADQGSHDHNQSNGHPIPLYYHGQTHYLYHWG